MKVVPVPRPRPQSSRERAAQRRFTWRLLLIGLATNVVGCGIHYTFVRRMGAMPAPRLPPEGPPAAPPRGKL